MKFLVVPESSWRCTVVIAVAGRSASGFWSAIAGSFHFVIFWSKICAIVSESRLSESTPSRLNITAIGETYAGTSMMSLPQRSLALLSSPSSSLK